jgi:hypothetical protein
VVRAGVHHAVEVLHLRLSVAAADLVEAATEYVDLGMRHPIGGF